MLEEFVKVGLVREMLETLNLFKPIHDSGQYIKRKIKVKMSLSTQISAVFQ